MNFQEISQDKNALAIAHQKVDEAKERAAQSKKRIEDLKSKMVGHKMKLQQVDPGHKRDKTALQISGQVNAKDN